MHKMTAAFGLIRRVLSKSLFAISAVCVTMSSVCERGADMFYTMEEAAVLGGFLELYLERASVDPAVRERHRKFQQGLLGGALERADYEWAAAALGFLRPQWWQEHEDHRALENALLKTRTLASKKE